jgi:hypothetical protein
VNRDDWAMVFLVVVVVFAVLFVFGLLEGHP